MFVDELNIKLMAGPGGDGCTSFRREKFVPMGGPDGGNGGRGASIIFKVDKSLKTLVDLSYKKIIKAPKGENGKGSNKYGKNAEDIIINVPEGTTIINKATNEIMADLINDGEEFVVAHGGRGGKGNKSFATHDVPAPKFSEKGEPWPKGIDEKNRFTHISYLKLYDRIFKKDKHIILKTDNKGLFAYSLETLSQYWYTFNKVSLDLHHDERNICNIMTDFEKQYEKEGRPIYYVDAKFDE